ncbi:MAG: hypothetical protein QXI19_10255 [Candidatus Caldarchaeum sp.]
MDLRRLRELNFLIRHTGVRLDGAIGRLLVASSLFPTLANLAERLLAFTVAPGILNPFLNPARSREGPFVIGYSITGGEVYPIAIGEQTLLRHIFVGGATGSGKTNWLNFLGSQLLEAGKGVIWIDMKQEARHLLRLFPDLWVFRIEDFRWNPLEPPGGVAPKWWLNAFASVYSHAFGILHASEGAILQFLDDLYQQYGVYEGSGRYPCLFDLLDYLRQVKVPAWSEHARYLQRTINRVETLCRTLGPMVEVSRGFSLERLLERSWVLEVGTVKPDVQSFVAEALLMAIFIYRIANGQRGQGVKNVVLFDDGKRVWDRNKEVRPPEGIPPITTLISQVREFGVACIVSDQDPGMVSQSLLDNTGTKICMALGSGKAIQEMAACMGLTQEQADFLYRLQPGQACGKTMGREPFLIVIPEFPIRKDVTDEEIARHMEKVLAGLEIVPRVPYEPEVAQEKVERPAMRFLEHVAREPLLSITERFRALGLSAWAGEKVVQELLQAGMVREEVIHRGGRGGRAKYLELTPKGREALRQEGVEVEVKGRGGIKHLYWQHKICKAFKSKGYYAAVEVPLGDMFLDVLASDREGKRIGVQVVTGELDAHEWEGIRKAVVAGLDEVLVLCEKSAVGEAITKRLPDVLADVGWETVRVMGLEEIERSLL